MLPSPASRVCRWWLGSSPGVSLVPRYAPGCTPSRLRRCVSCAPLFPNVVSVLLSVKNLFFRHVLIERRIASLCAERSFDAVIPAFRAVNVLRATYNAVETAIAVIPLKEGIQVRERANRLVPLGLRFRGNDALPHLVAANGCPVLFVAISSSEFPLGAIFVGLLQEARSR